MDIALEAATNEHEEFPTTQKLRRAHIEAQEKQDEKEDNSAIKSFVNSRKDFSTGIASITVDFFQHAYDKRDLK